MLTAYRKSQATIFLVLGVVIIIAVFLKLSANRNYVESSLSTEIANSRGLLHKTVSIENFVEECLSITSKDSLLKFGKQSGLLFVSQGSIIPDYKDLDKGIEFVTYKNFDVSFIDKNGIKEISIGENSIQKQLEFYITNNIDNCLNFSFFENQGLKIYGKEKTVNVSINENDVTFEMLYPLTIVTGKGNNKVELIEFSVKHPVRLLKIHGLIKEIINKDITDIEHIVNQHAEEGFSLDTENSDFNDAYVLIINDAKSLVDGAPYTYYFAKEKEEGIRIITGAVVSLTNQVPTANAGLNRIVRVGETTRLFGSGYDEDNDTLTFKWELIDKPGGSIAALSREDILSPTFTPDIGGAYSFRFRTNDGKSFSAPSNVLITAREVTGNIKPVSWAGVNKTVNVKDNITLTGSGYDEDGDSITYMWYTVSSPISLRDPYTQSPNFMADTAGTYVFGLITNDGEEDSVESRVTITASNPGVNRMPASDPGNNKTIKVNQETYLLGNGYDADKDTLNFLWSFKSKPSSSTSILSDPNIANPSFIPDVEGIYIFGLVVDDGQLESKLNTVTYSAVNVFGNNKPIANAGSSRNVNVSNKVIVYGNGNDADGDTLVYRWAIKGMPVGSKTFLSNPNQQNPFFIPDVEGEYTFALIVNDGKEDSLLSLVTITAAGVACIHRTCDFDNDKWCNDGVFTSEGYCDVCSEDSSCITCVGNSCDAHNKKWCENGRWKNGTYEQYCARCSYADNSCPICEGSICDIANNVWCNNGKWTAIDYCISCGSSDSLCQSTACTEGICDVKSKSQCTNNSWIKTDYCLKCGKFDSSCFFECVNNACDISSKMWCNQSIWVSDGYCERCGNIDFSCGTACQNNICELVVNKWCNLGSWDSLNYCDRCQDSECLSTCTNNACDIDAKKWCNQGKWNSIDYCLKCGNKDSSCAVTCEENVCDTTANKICYNGTWTSENYCGNCALRDSDCSIGCAEGQCDVVRKLVCQDRMWTNGTYCSLCSYLDNRCISLACLSSSDGCCLEEGDGICDEDCARNETNEDPDCNINITSIATCEDRIKNGDETDVDCGGNCDKCLVGKNCNLGGDCETGLCSLGICKEDTCNDRLLNDKETDIDCGGDCANKCSKGQKCLGDSDCIGLSCISNLCSEKKDKDEGKKDEPKEDEKKDSDKDNITDKWELKYGMNPNNATDAKLDMDKDGLSNVKEFTLGTNPTKADSDGDGYSDKEEIDKETNPLDVVSKPGGIGGLLFAVIIIIILFGAGSYVFYFYKDKIFALLGLKLEKEPISPTFMSAPMPMLQKPIKPKPAVNIEQKLVEKRRAEKEAKREKIFEAFGKEEAKKTEEKEKTEEEDAFSELKDLPK